MKRPCFAIQIFFPLHTFFWSHTTSFVVYKVKVDCLYICHQLPVFFKQLCQNTPYKAENWLEKLKIGLFSWRDKIFSIVAGSIWFAFRYILNVFTSKISNLLLPLGAEKTGGLRSWILMYLKVIFHFCCIF